MSIVMSNGQAEAFKKISDWYRKSDEKEFVLAGYAGTGKSTIANKINEETGGKAHFAAFTGKAANVLREKGCAATTLHKALYTPTTSEEVAELEERIKQATQERNYGMVDKLVIELAAARLRANRPVFELNPNSVISGEFVIVDEYSMLSQELIADLRKLARKILYLGDPEQLPPVNGVCGLTPDAFLTEIHRQALDSPIIRYATAVREGHKLQYINEPGFQFAPRAEIAPSAYSMAEQIIVGRNDTRRSWNNRFRHRRGHKIGSLPQAGEKIICLKNSPENDLFNGMICRAAKSTAEHEDYYVLECEDEETEWQGLNVWLGDIDGREEGYNFKRHRGLERFDFAYAITCHKSQGSEFGDVLIYNEPVGRDAHDCRRWLYTAITRAKNHVVLVDPV